MMEGQMKKNQFKSMPNLFLLCLFCLLCLFVSGITGISSVYGNEIVDRIVAQVNDDIITLQDLNAALKPYIEKIRSMGYPPEQEQQLLFKARDDVLNEKINDKLTDQEIQEEKISIDEKDIDAAIERVKEMNHLTQEQLGVELAKEGMSIEDYRKTIREQMLRSRLVNLKVKSKIVITKEDIKSYYDKNPEKYSGKKQYHLRSIVKKLPDYADEAGKKAILDELASIRLKLDGGESFETLAGQYSDFLAEYGGDMGLFTLDELSPEIRSAVSSLKEKESTPVIDTDQGFQIFYLENIVVTPGKPLEEVSGEIEEILYKNVVDEKFKTWVNGLKEKSHIKIIQ
jgi:peptidyl-prolyl cis-trans isomerase SurA